ncbi:hypothetical protein CUMW_226760 [Citrus unshiu]|uniref:Uncharacterized protein n=1 Tax=Citrus unshiu TaxID=55188 RepID=A0A2H5QG29_CITUN|nr:hypothetical protein CUMW_226760 [Citrus unshiu]
MLYKELKVDGILLVKELSCIPRYSKLVQPPRVVGISPENMLLEISNETRFFKLPTFVRKWPLRRLSDRSSKTERVMMRRSCRGTVPLSLFLRVVNKIKF